MYVEWSISTTSLVFILIFFSEVKGQNRYLKLINRTPRGNNWLVLLGGGGGGGGRERERERERAPS